MHSALFNVYYSRGAFLRRERLDVFSYARVLSHRALRISSGTPVETLESH